MTMKRFLLLIAAIACSTSLFAQEDTTDLLYYAQQKHGLGQMEEALELVNAHLESNPDHCEALATRATIYVSLEQSDKALEDVNKALNVWKAEDPIYRSLLYWWRADIYKQMGMRQAAIEDYTEALKLCVEEENEWERQMIMLDLAKIYAQFDIEKSDQIVQQLLEEDPTLGEARLLWAENLIAEGAAEEAKHQLDIYIAEGAVNPEAYLMRMKLRQTAGQSEEAIDDAIDYMFEYFGREDADLEPALEIMKLMPEYTIQQLDKRIALQADQRGYKAMMLTAIKGDFCRVAGYSREEIEALDVLEKDMGESADICLLRGLAYHSLGELEKALSQMLKAESLNSEQDKSSYFIQLGLIYADMGKYNKALEYYDKVLALKPEMVQAYYQRGFVYELMGNDAKAMENYNAGIAVDESYPQIYLMRAEQYLKQGKTELAMADFEHILQIDNHPKYSCRHYALYFLGDEQGAIEWMEKVVANNHQWGSVYYDKACLYGRMGRTDEALEALEMALERGFKAFAHIENDDDMDPIRNRAKFKKLMKKYKAQAK